jgi:hypothetical protein
LKEIILIQVYYDIVPEQEGKRKKENLLGRGEGGDRGNLT